MSYFRFDESISKVTENVVVESDGRGSLRSGRFGSTGECVYQ